MFILENGSVDEWEDTIHKEDHLLLGAPGLQRQPRAYHLLLVRQPKTDGKLNGHQSADALVTPRQLAKAAQNEPSVV
ncbi:hypothetical protein N7513_001880 [Penicillium frequentans]|nr:hypothetical protein N7513_001880 [Penicillium glabrum]